MPDDDDIDNDELADEQAAQIKDAADKDHNEKRKIRVAVGAARQGPRVQINAPENAKNTLDFEGKEVTQKPGNKQLGTTPQEKSKDKKGKGDFGRLSWEYIGKLFSGAAGDSLKSLKDAITPEPKEAKTPPTTPPPPPPEMPATKPVNSKIAENLGEVAGKVKADERHEIQGNGGPPYIPQAEEAKKAAEQRDRGIREIGGPDDRPRDRPPNRPNRAI